MEDMPGTNGLNALKTLYAQYLADLAQLQSERKPGEGLLGMNRPAREDARHELFAAQAEAAIAQLTPAEAAPALDFIFESAAAQPRNSAAQWMFLAVFTLAQTLVPLLPPADAAALAAKADALFPKRERLPGQKQLLQRLKKRSTAQN